MLLVLEHIICILWSTFITAINECTTFGYNHAENNVGPKGALAVGAALQEGSSITDINIAGKIRCICIYSFTVVYDGDDDGNGDGNDVDVDDDFSDADPDSIDDCDDRAW